MMKTFRREYRVSLEEEDALIQKMVEPLRDAILEKVEANAEMAVDELMRMKGVTSDMTFTMTWEVNLHASNFIEALEKIRKGGL